jgi:hypothetical protein
VSFRADAFTDPEWFGEAPCESDDHFPTRGEDASAIRVRRAVRQCLTRCPFRERCLERAYETFPHPVTDELVDASEEGIWGGTTPQERKAVAHLPMSDRLAILQAWVRTKTTGAFAPASESEILEVA